MGVWSNLLKRVYKWTLPRDYYIIIPSEYSLPDFKNKWLSIHNNNMIISANYSWDGCSPKRIIFGKMVGTWDGPINPETEYQWCYEASLIHDVLCQFKVGHRKTADKAFRHLLDGFDAQRLYYNAVRIASLFFKTWPADK